MKRSKQTRSDDRVDDSHVVPILLTPTQVCLHWYNCPWPAFRGHAPGFCPASQPKYSSKGPIRIPIAAWNERHSSRMFRVLFPAEICSIASGLTNAGAWAPQFVSCGQLAALSEWHSLRKELQQRRRLHRSTRPLGSSACALPSMRTSFPSSCCSTWRCCSAATRQYLG